MNTKPQLYNVELTNAVRNNDDYINLLVNTFDIPKENIGKITEGINSGKKVIVACVPLDIAKTKAEIFTDMCKQKKYSSTMHARPSGKYDDLI